MQVIIAWDGDHIGRKVGQASLNDDAEGLRRISQSIDLGNQMVKNWVLAAGGETISMGGDEGRAAVPADKLGELETIRHQYAELVGAPVSMGVGIRLSEADKALLAAKLQGGDRIVLYTDKVEDVLKELQEKSPKSEAEKLAEEYQLGKAEPSPGLNQGGAHAGMSGASHPSGPAKPQQDAPESSPGVAAREYVEENAPASDLPQPAPSDIEEQLHGLAQQQDQEDQATVAAGTGKEAAKQVVVKVLQELKSSAETMEQLKEASPEAYKLVSDSVQAMLAMVKQLDGAAPLGKSEALSKDETSGWENVHPAHLKMKPGTYPSTMGEGHPNVFDYSHLLPEQYRQPDPQTGKSHILFLADSRTPGARGGRAIGVMLHSPQGDDIGSMTPNGTPFVREDPRMPEPLRQIAQQALNHYVRFVPSATNGVYNPVPEVAEHQKELTDPHTTCPQCQADQQRATTPPDWRPPHSIPEDYYASEDNLNKGRLPMPKPVTQHHLQLPAGATKDGKVKVVHGDGSSGWKQVRAGMVLSQDGHAVSAREPNAK